MTDHYLEIKSADVEGSEGSGEFTAVLSTAQIDRDGEYIKAFAFDPLPSHINIDCDHDARVLKIVASGEPSYDENGVLNFKGRFAAHPDAQLVRQLVKDGHIRHLSLRMAPGAVREFDEVRGVPFVKSGELLNGSFVAIPANVGASVLSSKSSNLGSPSTDAPDTGAEELAAVKLRTLDAELEIVGMELEEMSNDNY